MDTMIISNCSILDSGCECGFRDGVDILIEGTEIAAIAPTGQLMVDPGTEIVDGNLLLAIPGLINAHSHSPETLGRASHDRLPLEPWLVYMNSAMGAYTPREHYLASMLGAIETLRTGGTSILDHLTTPGGCSNEVVDSAMQAYADVGIRATVAPLFPDPTEEIFENELARRFDTRPVSESPLPPPPSIKEQESVLRAFHSKWEGACDGRLRCGVGPGGVQWCGLQYLHFCFDLARDLDMCVHTHLMETRVQERTIHSMRGMSAVEFLKSEGFLEPRLSLPHSVWLTDRDVRLIAEGGATPVHNPAANMRLGSGLSPIKKFLEAGCIPALGADGSMSSDHQNMFGVLHLAAQIHNSRPDGFDPKHWVSSREVFEMATRGGARALRMEGRIGKLGMGRLADITLLDLNTPAMCPMHDAFHSMAYTIPSCSVKHVIVNGKIVVRDGHMATVDERAIFEECREVSARHRFAKKQPECVETRVREILHDRNELYSTTKFENQF